MKKTLVTILFLQSIFTWYGNSQIKPINERLEIPQTKKNVGIPGVKDKIFCEIDLVELGSNVEKISYLIGENAQNENSNRLVKKFRINRYETTYALWHSTRIWAENHGYNFANPGQEGSLGKRGKRPTKTRCNEPVTMINWHDAIVWCNALSEKNNLTPCYRYEGKILRDSSDAASCDLAQCDFNASGFRLPTEAEWEFAARKTSNGLQSGNLASGQINENGFDDESIPTTEIAWIFKNTKKTCTVGTAGTPFEESSMPSPGSGNPNGAGLFDMSGNILEFCWDWSEKDYSATSEERFSGPKFGAERIMRGGAWNEYTMFIAAGDRYSFDPNEAYDYFGFRICTSQ